MSRKAQQQGPATRAHKLFRNDIHASVCDVRTCFSSIASTKSCEFLQPSEQAGLRENFKDDQGGAFPAPQPPHNHKHIPRYSYASAGAVSNAWILCSLSRGASTVGRLTLRIRHLHLRSRRRHRSRPWAAARRRHSGPATMRSSPLLSLGQQLMRTILLCTPLEIGQVVSADAGIWPGKNGEIWNLWFSISLSGRPPNLFSFGLSLPKRDVRRLSHSAYRG